VLARLVVSLVVLAGALIAVAAFVPIPTGPLEEGGIGVSGPRSVEEPFTVGTYALRNESRWPLEIEEVRLAEDVPGLLFLGALVTGGGHGVFDFEDGFPPDASDVPDAIGLSEAVLRPAAGAVVSARGRRPLLVGLFADRPGRFRVPELEVAYRLRVLGRFGPLMRERIRDEVWVCARPRGERGACHLPPEDDA
jgi:hypothetical protein